MKKLFTAVLCSLMLLGLSCSSENEPNVSDNGKEQPVNLQEEEPNVPEECSWDVVESISLTEDLKVLLNDVFSMQNELVKNIAGDTIVLVINNEQDFLKISNETVSINFEKYSVI
jgi:hypothetical protein